MQASELQKRIFFGAIAALVSLALLIIGGVYFFVFVLAITFIMSVEFDRLRKDGITCFAFLVLPVLFSRSPEIALLLLIIAVGLIIFLERIEKIESPWLWVSVVYIALPAIAILCMLERMHGFEITLWVIFSVVATDIGAYFIGRKFGKHPLAPKVSPNKTWEGLAGGAALAAITSYLFTGVWALSFLAIAFAFIAQAGDLTESAIKRHFGVKDTGNFLPGHGGLMDRLDGLLYTLPLGSVLAYYEILAW